MNTKVRSRTPLDVVAERLREMSLDRSEGVHLGNEDTLMAQLACARTTIRQAARLLEREGLLKVRRGIHGGYFSARPDADIIESTVSAYLTTLKMDPSEVTVLASALWVEAMRKAAGASADGVGERITRLRDRIAALPDLASFEMVRTLERESQDAIFEIADCNYIKLIFEINIAFSQRRFSAPITDDDSPDHRLFVRRWRDAKLLELDALSLGDRELAVAAAQLSRKVWHSRVRRRFANLDQQAALERRNG